MLLSCAIDPKEGRHVAVTDIPGAFLLANTEQDVHMLLEGTIAKIITNWIQNYKENIYEKINMTNQCYL